MTSLKKTPVKDDSNTAAKVLDPKKEMIMSQSARIIKKEGGI